LIIIDLMRMPTRREWIKSNWITYPIVGLLLQSIDPSGPDDVPFIRIMGLLMMFGWGVVVLIKLLIWMAGSCESKTRVEPVLHEAERLLNELSWSSIV
jgi:hypothetical protein